MGWGNKFLLSSYGTLVVFLRPSSRINIINNFKFMELLSWIILGFVAGWLASIVMNTDTTQDAMLDIILGVIGAFVGGWLLSVFGQPSVTGLNLYSIFVSVLGAAVLIGLGRTLKVRA